MSTILEFQAKGKKISKANYLAIISSKIFRNLFFNSSAELFSSVFLEDERIRYIKSVS